MTFHIGLIGGGNITETHARAARALPGVEISAIHGTNAEKIARLCREHGGKDDWCDQCTQSARVGNWLATGIVAAVLGVSLLFLLLSQSPALR